ncbi:YIP1 family protein [Ferrimonas marina]|uniref:Yip1 domain-containing protein n=1 Tax=Ferrimonas marina TaxID=299255 RepID=A0A1M5Z3V5_9GAMM|nr:YIP1 family protein [Ferrimonas marina]SHI18925.1 Yip1 domain-containing protein [Ferrimonas marina]
MVSPTQAKDALLTFPRQPGSVLLALKQARGWSWLPALLLVGGFVLVYLGYFLRVDFDWYTQQHVAPMFSQLSPADQKTMLASLTRPYFLGITLFSGLAFWLIGQSLMAFYLAQMTKLDDDNLQGFGDWFGLCWWVQLPSLLAIAIALLAILFGGNQLDPDWLNPLALNRLVGLEYGEPGQGVLDSLTLLLPLHLWLLQLGIRRWTSLSTGVSWAITLLPPVLLYGLWALLF